MDARRRDPSDPTPRLARAGRFALIFAVVFALGFGVLTVLLGDGRQVASHLAQLDTGFVVLLLVLSLVNYVLRGLRWQVFSRRAGLSVPYRRTLLYYFGGFAMLLTPGKVGELVRLWLLKRGHGVPYERSIGLMIADRLTDGLAFALLILVGLSSFAAFAPAIWAAVALVTAVTVALVRPALLLRLVGWVHGVVGRWPRLFARLRRALRHASALAAPTPALAAMILSLIGWFAEISAFHMLLDAFGAQVTVAEATFVFSFAAIVGALVVIPGGLGGTEATLLGLLALLKVEPSAALAATLVIRATTLWFAAILGFMTLPAAIRATVRKGL